MKALFVVIPLWFLLSAAAMAQTTYPTCPTTQSDTSCTITVHVTSTPTPVFAKHSSRNYLFLQNTGYTFGAGPPAINNNVVFCSIGSGNAPLVQSNSGINVMVIEAGGTYEPEQIVKPQTAFTVPAGDVSCVAPFGDVWLAALQE